MKINVISVVAKSGTGKTTLLEKLISELKSRGYRVGALKHDAHKFEIDHEGKDSWRLTKAGADTMMISSKEKFAIVKRYYELEEPPVEVLVEKYFDDVDILLTEGFKKNSFPKIEVHRKGRSSSLLCRGESFDETLIAVATDEDLDLDVPTFHIDDYMEICNFIEKRYLRCNLRAVR